MAQGMFNPLGFEDDDSVRLFNLLIEDEKHNIEPSKGRILYLLDKYNLRVSWIDIDKMTSGYLKDV